MVWRNISSGSTVSPAEESVVTIAILQQSRIRSSRVETAAAGGVAGASWPLPKPGAGSFPGPRATFCQLALFAIPTQCVHPTHFALQYYIAELLQCKASK